MIFWQSHAVTDSTAARKWIGSSCESRQPWRLKFKPPRAAAARADGVYTIKALDVIRRARLRHRNHELSIPTF
ncbi:hypothetical protein EVAR_41787_1 [Eumeta japonica]|uniref:Uncharacterized protein n=1 Tax=Eumeta variegata TaxID=151549 RepID=A0A4C1VZB2_EUMVA|nr:hypothetical protein EVAR_41787_1 [Eumeta japonica]